MDFVGNEEKHTVVDIFHRCEPSRGGVSGLCHSALVRVPRQVFDDSRP